jgi:hypothetical protein
MTQTTDDLLDTILAGYTERQIEHAQELLDTGSLIPAARPGNFLAVSSDGTTTYRCSPFDCDCRSRKPCYHMLGAKITMALA